MKEFYTVTFIQELIVIQGLTMLAVNIGEQRHDGNLPPTLEPVESIRSNSSTEVVYCEILDVSVRNQVASDYKSQEDKVLGKSSNSDGVSEPVKVETSRHTGQVRD